VKRIIALMASLALIGLGLMAVPASAAQPRWDMTGTYKIHYYLNGVGAPYDHTDTITVTSFGDPTVNFTGTGYYDGDPANYTETITGTLTGDDLAFKVDYTGANPTYEVNAVGTVASDGSLSGTAASNTGQQFTWTATGKARPFGYTNSCSVGSFVSSQGRNVTLPTVPGHKYRIDVSGTYYAGGNGLYDIRADAEYSQDRAQFAAGAGWTPLVNGYSGANLLDLMVDGQGVNWGDYNSSHAYSMEKVAADGALSFAFNVYDSYPSNNTGGLCVSLTDLGNIDSVNGFFAPVNQMPTDNVAKAGQTIPLKWRVLDYNGNPVSELAGLVDVTSSPGINGSGTNDALEAYASGGSGLQYLGDGYWQYNWKTEKAWASTGRTVTVTIGSYVTIQAEFIFR
jgi:hypothetical protein